MTFVGLASGQDFSRKKRQLIVKWLCGKQMLLVGAVGFEPTTSTV